MHPLIATYLHHTKTKAAIIVLAFKTDFAARTNEAIHLAQSLAMLAVGYNCKNIAEIMSVHITDDKTVATLLDNLSKQLQEPVKILKLEVIDGFDLLI